MIDDLEYKEKIYIFFDFLITEFGFEQSKEIFNGNMFYDIQFKDTERIVSISYENVEDYLLVIIYILENDILPNYDDKSKTLHLSYLTKFIFPKIDKNEIILNNESFSHMHESSKFGKRLLKMAKDLRLCLKFFNKFPKIE